MLAERIRNTPWSETWRVPLDSGRHRYIKIVADRDEDTIFTYAADQGGTWVGDGTRYDSFEAARSAEGLPAIEEVPDAP